jgi:hypothetical protein
MDAVNDAAGYPELREHALVASTTSRPPFARSEPIWPG